MGKVSLTVLLRSLGFLMERASKNNPWFRNQVTRDLVIEVRTRDGFAHHFQFMKATRRVMSKAGPAPRPTISVCFDTSLQGFLTLSHPHPVGKVVNGVLDRRITAEGNMALLLWFHGLTRVVLPIARHRPLKEPLPGALMHPNPQSKVFDQVCREPVTEQLDPRWSAALAARSTLINLRSPTGEAVPMW